MASHQQSGVLRVKLTHALGLKSMDSNGYSDPYVKMSFGKQTHKSSIVKKSLNPRWDENFSFRGNYSDFAHGMIEIQCWDHDTFSRNDPLGNGTLQLSHLVSKGLAEGANIVCSVQLKDNQARPGEIFFEIMWEWDHPGARPPPQPGSGMRGVPPYGGAPGRMGVATPYSRGSSGGVDHRIMQTFNYFDTNRSGYLDYGELRAALRHYGIHADVLQSAEIVRRYDDQPDGKLEVAEFSELIRDLEQGVVRSARTPYSAGPQVPARVAAAFDECDVNRSGFLDYAELRPALHRYGVDVSEAGAASIVRAYDDHPDGKMDLTEFARLVRDIESGTMRREGRSPYSGYEGGYNGGRYGESYRGRNSAPTRSSPSYRGGSSYASRYGGSSSLVGGSSSMLERGASSSSSEQRGTGALLYLLDVLFRTVVYALATAALVAPDKVVTDADAVARAAGKESAAQVIQTVPMAVWYSILGLLLVLLLISANCCGLRRPIVACFDCSPGPCSRFCHTLMSCCRERRYGVGSYERWGGEYGDEPRSHYRERYAPPPRGVGPKAYERV